MWNPLLVETSVFPAGASSSSRGTHTTSPYTAPEPEPWPTRLHTDDTLPTTASSVCCIDIRGDEGGGDRRSQLEGPSKASCKWTWAGELEVYASNLSRLLGACSVKLTDSGELDEHVEMMKLPFD